MFLAVGTALRVFLPDLLTGVRRLLHAEARIGIAELAQSQQARPADPQIPAVMTSRDTEVQPVNSTEDSDGPHTLPTSLEDLGALCGLDYTMPPSLEAFYRRYACAQTRYAAASLGDKQAAKAVVHRLYTHLALRRPPPCWTNTAWRHMPGGP